MKFIETALDGAYIVELDTIGDERGFFARVFCSQEFEKQGLTTSFVQVNDSYSAYKGTLRGMHYQLSPFQETKLVRCIKGRLLDVILDLRKGSRSFGAHLKVELSAKDRRMLYVPKGFAHSFITLEDETEAIYFVDAYYSPEHERAIRWNDPRFGIDWPMQPTVVSAKDAAHPDFDPAYHLPG